MSELVCFWRRTKAKGKMIVIKQELVGEQKSCPKCHAVDMIYVHLDHKEDDPIAPKYWCIGCHHEWDEKEDRLGHND